MQVCPTEADWALAREVHGFFAPKPGARHIASEFALAYLHTLLNDSHPKHVLEFGAGIGTITTCLLNHSSRIAQVTATEENEFCIGELSKNVGDGYAGRYQLVTEPTDLDVRNVHYDLVVVDPARERALRGDYPRYDLFRRGLPHPDAAGYQRETRRT